MSDKPINSARINWPTSDEITQVRGDLKPDLFRGKTEYAYNIGFGCAIEWLSSRLQPQTDTEEVTRLKAELTQLQDEGGEATRMYYECKRKYEISLFTVDSYARERDALKAEIVKYELAQQGNLAKLDELNARFEKDADYQELKAENQRYREALESTLSSLEAAADIIYRFGQVTISYSFKAVAKLNREALAKEALNQKP